MRSLTRTGSEVEAMRRVLLAILVVVWAVSAAMAQEPAEQSAKAATGITDRAAARVRAELTELEEEKVNCFSSIGEDAGWSATWIKWHDADRIIHISDRLRSKTELMDELRSGVRRNLVNVQYNHVFHIYGNGGDGTTVVITYTSTGEAMSMAGVRSVSEKNDLGIDVWYKQDGRWWFIVHPPGTGEPEPPSGEAAADEAPHHGGTKY